MINKDELNVTLKNKFNEIHRKKSLWGAICNKISLIIVFVVVVGVTWVVQVSRERLWIKRCNENENVFVKKIEEMYQGKVKDLRARNHYYIEEASMTKAHLTSLRKDLAELKTTNERLRETISDLENEVKQHTMSIIDINKKCNDLKPSIF